MKKNGILNSEISRVISYMGHTDQITIGDCGLPIPSDVERIDLSVILGVPSFIDVLDAMIQDFKVEKIFLAEEIKSKNPSQNEEILKRFEGIEVVYISHEELKQMTQGSKAVIRTGEASPYSNIILQSGVIF